MIIKDKFATFPIFLPLFSGGKRTRWILFLSTVFIIGSTYLIAFLIWETSVFLPIIDGTTRRSKTRRSKGYGLVVGSRFEGASDEYTITRAFGNLMLSIAFCFFFHVSKCSFFRFASIDKK